MASCCLSVREMCGQVIAHHIAAAAGDSHELIGEEVVKHVGCCAFVVDAVGKDAVDDVNNEHDVDALVGLGRLVSMK